LRDDFTDSVVTSDGNMGVVIADWKLI